MKGGGVVKAFNRANQMQCNIGQLSKKEFLIPIGIALLALFVRLFYLYESSVNPSFTMPIVDSRNYDDLARTVADGQGMHYGFFWQPFFYPAFLSTIYLVSNSSMICAKIIQLLLGCITCLLTYLLGKRVFCRPVGVIAGTMTALYGPLIFFEAELLATGWAAFWSVVLVLLFIKSSLRKVLLIYLILGICGALSVITRPTFLPFFTVAVGWLVIVFRRSGDALSAIVLRLGLISTGFLLVALPVATQNFHVTGHFGFLPGSGPINIYVGNNPSRAETVAARPGQEWIEILDLAILHGFTGDQWVEQKFYRQKVVDYILTEPLGFVRGLVYKTVQFLSSREIPRNLDIYLFRKWSRLLSLLTWKVANFGFPFGILLPLALWGLVRHWRQITVPLILFIILYPLSIILVFVTARYRVVVTPVMSVLAAAGLMDLIKIVSGCHWRRFGAVCVFGVPVVALSSIPGPFPEEKLNYEAEFYFQVAVTESLAGKNDEALAHSRKVLELVPDHPLAHFRTALILERISRTDEAIHHYRQAVRIKPDLARAHTNLGMILFKQGRFNEAITHYEYSIQLKKNQPFVLNKLGESYFLRGETKEAFRCWNKVLELEPERVETMNNLAWIKATDENPDIRNPEEAVQLALRACKLTGYNRPDILDTLAVAYGAAGRFGEAIETAAKAISLAETASEQQLADEIQRHMELFKQKQPYRQSSTGKKGGK